MRIPFKHQFDFFGVTSVPTMVVCGKVETRYLEGILDSCYCCAVAVACYCCAVAVALCAPSSLLLLALSCSCSLFFFLSLFVFHLSLWFPATVQSFTLSPGSISLSICMRTDSLGITVFCFNSSWPELSRLFRFCSTKPVVELVQDTRRQRMAQASKFQVLFDVAQLAIGIGELLIAGWRLHLSRVRAITERNAIVETGKPTPCP